MKGVEQIEHAIYDLTHPRRSYTFWGLLAVLVLAGGLVWLKHGEWLRAPNEYMLSGSPDGLKNYMTAAWHVAYDSSYVHYGGMGYPYGEHVLFTDNQPIISAAMQWWSHNVSNLDGRVVGTMNNIIAISLVLGAAVIFLLLRKLHLPVWYAGLGALAMLFLAPQNMRIEGHYALSHTWILPLLLFLLCRYEERYSRRYQALLIGILVWLASQIHFYYFGISILFLGLYTFVQLCMDPSVRNFRVRLSHLVVMVLLPFVLLNIWIHWSDYATDRPSNPYGFTSYIGYWEGVFLPYPEFPFYKWIDTNIVPIRKVESESRAYVGMAGFALTLWIVFFRRFRLFKPSWDEAAFHRVHKRYLKGIFVTSFILLIFSCGFPFAISGMEWMTEYFGPFRQFRGLGRFNWMFFYVINTLLLYIAWNYSVRFKGFSAKKSPNPQSPIPNPVFPQFRWVIALLPLALLSYEAWILQGNLKIQPRPNIALRSEALKSCPWLEQVDFSPYQALMPLPYYHIGSENIWLDLDWLHYPRMHTMTQQTGLPDMAVNMSRTSIGHTIKSLQFALGQSEAPVLLDELPDNRPIALVVNASKWDEVQQKYSHLVQSARMVFEHPDVKIMSLAPDSLRTWYEKHALGVAAEMNRATLYPAGKTWKSDRQDGWFTHLSFDSLTTTEHIFQGKGAFEGTMSDTTWLFNAPLPKGTYSISAWIYVKRDMGMTQEMKIYEKSRADGHEISYRHEGMRFHLKSIVDGWALFEIGFDVREDNSDLRIFMQKKGVHEPWFLDEVLIKQLNFNLYRQTPGWLSHNNYWFKTTGR
jgi:hypothetical protein